MIDLGTSKSTFGCPCSATTDLETHGFDDLVICFVFPMGSPNWWILYREKNNSALGRGQQNQNILSLKQ
jgi:hypothetical protein